MPYNDALVEEKKHLYNSRLGKVRWFVERFGAREVVMKPLRMILAPLIIPTLGSKTFAFQGKTLPYLLHRYNMTWASERCVEVPIGRSILEGYPPEAALEIGNVLSHYGTVHHDILDKFEKRPGVINKDVITFKPQKRYQIIVSISTFEHIGYDDETEGSSADKIKQAIRACLQFLNAEGELVITIPIGYNPELDGLIKDEALLSKQEAYMKKFGPLDWRECSRDDALACRYKSPFPYANAIGVLRFVKS